MTVEGTPIQHFDRHTHVELGFLQKETGRATVVLAGNPNVGKSLLFNHLSGLYVDVSNFPGTTVEVNRGSYGELRLYDTPGIYGVSSFNDEERVARDIILEADIVLNVVDGTHLERDLFLTQQLIDMGKRVSVLVNFMDEVRRNRMTLDLDALSHLIGVPVYPIVAVAKEGFERLDEAISSACEGVQRESLHSMLHTMLSRVGSQGEALLVMEGDEVIAARHGIAPGSLQEVLYVERRNRVNYVVTKVLTDVHVKSGVADLLGRWALRPLTGLPMLAVALFLVYLFVGKLVAQDLVNFTEKTLGHQIVEPWLHGMVVAVVPGPGWLHDLLVGEFGIITMTTTYLFFLLLPLVASFYFALSVLEDSGYLPRLATMVDRTFSYIGLNGRAVIPIILGFGCITSATVTTRLLGTEREKTIVTAILQFVIPCSAQLAVIAALLAGAGPGPMAVYGITIITVLIAIGTILNRSLPGESGTLLLDLPPMRIPKAANVVRKTAIRTRQFMMEASGWFFIGALAVSVAQLTGALALMQRALVPITVHWLQLPAGAATAFIMGIVRRDFGAAGLYHLELAPMESAVALIVITLFVPCIASLMVMMKERGWKEGMAIWIGTWLAAFTVGGVVSQIVL